ncbi:MAG: pirin family protein [Acaryochloris sp. RU_4_1]|nr:pirin family protein [Acaryochloris sp. RU_4_1]NJR54688.1 pirin family protein [Acaryochloris sp. CRU_2_0]
MSKTAHTHLVHDRQTRGHTQINWLDSYHTFSFGEFYDANRLGFRALRVINEDRVLPSAGFATHSHRDMEIVTYVLEGALQHQDSLRNGAIIRPGDAQIMSAGTGITHSELNASASEPVHFLQIWLLPDRQGLQPGYEQKHFPLEQRQNQLCLMADPQGRAGAVTIHQDTQIYAAVLTAGEQITYPLAGDRYGWLQVARGRVLFHGESLQAGDGVQLSGGKMLTIETPDQAEVLLFDLA